ncbi:MAG TPA: RluA family pseudouridine synthase [Cellvibrionaceae bacterium]
MPEFNHPIDIIHQDRDLLVVGKPAGLLTVPGRGPDKQDCLINRLLIEYPNSRVVHRLDQATSGLVIIPQSHAALRHIGEQFEQRVVSKTYIAVVAGLLPNDTGSVAWPLICDWPRRPRQKIDFTDGKAALTHYRVLNRDLEKKCTRVELTPVTGRSHQLRVHMLAIGHPIMGDQLYAPETVTALNNRLLLHAQSIEFNHPVTQEKLHIRSCAPF